MLKKNYDNVYLGLNYISLIMGIIKQEQGNSGLIIDHPQYSQTSNWLLNIGLVDKYILEGHGKNNGIYPLENLDQYLRKVNGLIYFNDKCVELSSSPYLNLKELTRKFPSEFLELFYPFIEKYNETEFNAQFSDFFKQLVYKNQFKEIEDVLKEENLPIIRDFLNTYKKFLSTDIEFIKQLNHIIQMMYQVKFSANINRNDSLFLFLLLISPRFLIKRDEFTQELTFHFKKLGGDLKNTSISALGEDENYLRYMTLNSLDGAIELKEAFFFGTVDDQFFLEPRFKGSKYKSIHFECPIDNDYAAFYQDKRIVFSENNRIGSDFPYWELRFEEKSIKGAYAYNEKQGSKASFYYPQLIEDVYQSLRKLLPGLIKADWVARVRLTQGEDVWFEGPKVLDKHDSKEKKKLYKKSNGAYLAGINHFGPICSGPRGLYSYLFDTLNS